MTPVPLVLLLLLALFAGILGCMEFGRRYGLRRMAADPEAALRGTGPVDGAIFALLGLMIAFTFSSASGRFDGRRELVREEANDIGTAWLRLELLGEPQRAELRELFRQYLDSRLATYQTTDFVDLAPAEYRRSEEIQGRIWTLAVEACRQQQSEAASRLLLPALNEMFDIANTRRAAAMIHQPPIVFAMLALLALLAGVIAGFSLASGRGRDWLHLIIFAVITTLTVYVIVDLEYPRLGLIRVDAIDQLLRDVRASMK